MGRRIGEHQAGSCRLYPLQMLLSSPLNKLGCIERRDRTETAGKETCSDIARVYGPCKKRERAYASRAVKRKPRTRWHSEMLMSLLETAIPRTAVVFIVG